MKNILLIITFFLLAQNTIAQLGEWSIDKVIIGGIEFQAPVNNETPQFKLFIYWDWDVYVFDNYHCGRLVNAAGIWFDDDTLYLGFLAHFTTDCLNNENNIFRDQHFGIFLDDTDKEYAYEVTVSSNGYWQLVITNEFGNQAIYLAPTLGLKEASSTSFKIYPNPVKDELFISSKSIRIEKIKVYSTTGNRVFEVSSDLNSIDISNLSKGLYFIEISSSEGKSVQKFIKN